MKRGSSPPFEHHRQVVQGGVGVGAAGGLDPGRDRVVVTIGLAVVEERAPLERVLGVGERDPAAGLTGQLERVQRRARVAAGARGKELERLGVDRSRARAVLHRTVEQHPDLVRRERVELIHASPRDQRRVDLEIRVLGRRADQSHEAVLDRRQQRVLLGLVEAVDLVEEEDRGAAGGGEALASPLDHGPDLGPACLHRALLLERRVGGLRHQPGQRRLAAPRRPVEDHRVRPALLERAAQRRARPEQPFLADELVERARAHARGQWCAGRRRLRRRALSSLSNSRSIRAGVIGSLPRCRATTPVWAGARRSEGRFSSP